MRLLSRRGARRRAQAGGIALAVALATVLVTPSGAAATPSSELAKHLPLVGITQGTQESVDLCSHAAAWDGAVFLASCPEDAQLPHQPSGSAENLALRAPIVGIDGYLRWASVSGYFQGYWLAAADGGVFSYSSVSSGLFSSVRGAPFYGSAAGLRLEAPITAIAGTGNVDHHGYWLAAADGGVFAFGDARFWGSAAGLRLRAPIVDMDDGLNAGYWLAAADGGVFAFGDARFWGSAANLDLRAPIVAITRYWARNGLGGYWLAAADGGVFAFGDAPYLGSAAHRQLSAPIVDIQATSNGYRLLGADGKLYGFWNR